MSDEKELNKLPEITCPKCADRAYAYALNFVCDGCKEAYRVDVRKFDFNKVNVVKPGFILPKDTFGSIIRDDVVSNDDQIIYKRSFDGPLAKAIKKIKKKHNFKTDHDVIDTLFTSMLWFLNFFSKQLDSSPLEISGDKIGRQKLTYKTLFGFAKKAIVNKRQDKESVNNFISKMQKEFVINDIKKHYNDLSELERNKDVK